MKTRSQTKSMNPELDGPFDPFVPNVPFVPTIYESTKSTVLPVYNGEIKNAMYDVEIDFDDASRCWTSNKRRLKNGCYQYICGAQLKNGNKCHTQRNKVSI